MVKSGARVTVHEISKLTFIFSVLMIVTGRVLRPFRNNSVVENRVPNLSPTDVVSSLFLQSLLVRALDSTLDNGIIPLNSLQTNLEKIQQTVDRNKSKSSVLDAAYRYRKILSERAKKLNNIKKITSHKNNNKSMYQTIFYSILVYMRLVLSCHPS